MSLVSSPYGLRPVQLLGGLPYAGAIRSYPLTTNNATGLFFGDPVGLVAGSIVTLSASPVAGTAAGSTIGIFMGAEWQDPIRGFVNAQFLPANLPNAGAKNIRCKILDSPSIVMAVQANAPVAAAALGWNIALAAGAGNVATGDSMWVATGAAAVTATLACRIVGFPDKPGSTPGDLFTDLLVIWNFGSHRLQLPLSV